MPRGEIEPGPLAHGVRFAVAQDAQRGDPGPRNDPNPGNSDNL
jgi:hypothetical protein